MPRYGPRFPMGRRPGGPPSRRSVGLRIGVALGLLVAIWLLRHALSSGGTDTLGAFFGR
jgi:hypothetical protein